VLTFQPQKVGTDIEDGVLIAIDAQKDYIAKNQVQISVRTLAGKTRDLNE
jgi:hypothetical protein